MDVWTSQSNSGKQVLISVVCAITGMALLIGFRNFNSADSNTLAGFLLGLLLLIIGIPGILFPGNQTVIVDQNSRSITIKDINCFRTKKRSIPFNDITGINIGALGKRSNLVMQYYLVLKLTSGENYSLFSPGLFYKGASDRSTVAGWKQRLETYLSQ
jgi:hypothetical protein